MQRWAVKKMATKVRRHWAWCADSRACRQLTAQKCSGLVDRPPGCWATSVLNVRVAQRSVYSHILVHANWTRWTWRLVGLWGGEELGASGTGCGVASDGGAGVVSWFVAWCSGHVSRRLPRRTLFRLMAWEAPKAGHGGLVTWALLLDRGTRGARDVDDRVAADAGAFRVRGAVTEK